MFDLRPRRVTNGAGSSRWYCSYCLRVTLLLFLLLASDVPVVRRRAVSTHAHTHIQQTNNRASCSTLMSEGEKLGNKPRDEKRSKRHEQSLVVNLQKWRVSTQGAPLSWRFRPGLTPNCSMLTVNNRNFFLPTGALWLNNLISIHNGGSRYLNLDHLGITIYFLKFVL